MRILRESRVPKKSVFTRAFGVFCFGMPWGRCPAPKCGAIPASLHPDIVLNFSVSGQICGQTTLLRDYRKEECPKKSVFTRVFGLWKNEKTGTACTLPNAVRYQLRYTPKIHVSFYRCQVLLYYIKKILFCQHGFSNILRKRQSFYLKKSCLLFSKIITQRP